MSDADTGAKIAPLPTKSVDRAMADLREFGACIVADALDRETLSEAPSALYSAATSDQKYGRRRDYQYGRDDHLNQRVWNLPSRDPVFCALAEHPIAMHFVREMLGWPTLLSSMSANITSGGAASMMLHADQGYMPQPWERPHGINVGWCIDEFTMGNGATSYIPGSHFKGPESVETDPTDQLVPLVAPAGSAIIMDGRVLHTNGVNTNGKLRAGIFSWYTLPIYLPQENWFLSVDPAVRQFGSETLLTLLGFRPGAMGRINGLDRI